MWSLGKGSEKGKWGDWTGTWDGLTGSTKGDVWLACRGAALLAGDASSAARCPALDAARTSSETANNIVELVWAGLGLADALAHFQPSVPTTVKTVFKAAASAPASMLLPRREKPTPWKRARCMSMATGSRWCPGTRR